MEGRPRTLSIEEAAGLLGLHPETVRQALLRGELDGTKVGDRWVLGAEALYRRLNTSWPEQQKKQQKER